MSDADPADRLYGLALEGFVPARDALARDLRAGGDKEAGARVRALRKPTRAAWAVNQVVRTQRREARELAEAGEGLVEAQRRLLAGEGSADELRAANDRERRAVAALVEAARGLLSGVGRDLGAGTLDRVGETLHAAAIDADTRALVLAGRLDRERSAAGLGPGLPGAFAGAGPETGAAPKPRGGGGGGAGADPAQDERATDRDREEAERRRAEEDARREAERRVAEARDAVTAAVSAQERAEAERETAEEGLEHAQEALAAAKRRLTAAKAAERESGRARERAERDLRRAQG